MAYVTDGPGTVRAADIAKDLMNILMEIGDVEYLMELIPGARHEDYDRDSIFLFEWTVRTLKTKPREVLNIVETLIEIWDVRDDIDELDRTVAFAVNGLGFVRDRIRTYIHQRNSRYISEDPPEKGPEGHGATLKQLEDIGEVRHVALVKMEEDPEKALDQIEKIRKISGPNESLDALEEYFQSMIDGVDEYELAEEENEVMDMVIEALDKVVDLVMAARKAQSE